MFSRSYPAYGYQSRAARVAMAEMARIRQGYWLANHTPCVFGHKTADTRPRGGST